jgi:hypothetical protein
LHRLHLAIPDFEISCVVALWATTILSHRPGRKCDPEENFNMPTATSHKAVAFRDEFASRFAIRSSLAQTKGYSATDQAPTLLVGAAATTEEGFFLKICTIAQPNVDVLGLQQYVYANHRAQIVFEANYAGATDSVADVQKWGSHLPAIAMLGRMGLRVEVYEETNGTVPSESSIVAGKLKATFEPNEQYPMMASM